MICKYNVICQVDLKVIADYKQIYFCGLQSSNIYNETKGFGVSG